MNTRIFNAALRSATILSATVLFSASALAQDTGATSAALDETVDDAETIVVTGSRISRPNLDSTIPITSVGSTDLLDTGQVSVGDQLNQLPQLRATFSQANSTRFIGTAGQNFLDLRGLGTERTLVLVNGRRHVSTAPGTFRWDVNNVPADLVERIDVVTGGNSAIYGSDAIAGVVNFVLKRKYDGIQLRAQAGISGEGDSASQFVSGIIGKNFADGRGNITVAAEYAKQDALYILDREQGRDRRQFQLTQNTGQQLNPSIGAIRTTPEPAAGDGISDSTFIGQLQRVTTSVGGTFTAVCPNAPASGETVAAFTARRAIACSGIYNPSTSNPLGQFGAAYAFRPDGTLVPNGCITDFRGFGSGNCIGGFGSTLRESGQFQPRLRRINATMLASFEVSPAFVPFFEGQYTDIKAVQEGAPTFGAQSYSLANPFLTAQAQSQLSSLLTPGVTTFSVDRQNLDFGARGEDHKRETWRVVGGARGSFNDDWSYEVAASYGKFTSYYETEGNYIRTRFANAINAVAAPTGYAGSNFVLNSSGQKVVCSVNADASATNDDPACYPADLFGQNRVAPQSLGYFSHTSSRKQKNEQFIASGFLSGDTSGFFNLPGGPIGFAVGGEYREEKQYSAFDAVTTSGATFLNSILPLDPPTYKIKDVFAEIRLPLLADVPFARELTVEGAGRFSDYNLGSTGTVFAWNAGVTWAPISDIKFRGSYQRSIRAPSLGDLFTQSSQTFNNSFADPCGQLNINNNPNRVANCAAAGVPTTQTFTVGGVTTTEPFTNRPTSGVAAASAGNPDLREERSKSITLGFVATPSVIPGLSISVDWYDIDIKDVIFTLAPQTVLEQCYDNPSGIDNPFCAVVSRLPNGTLAGQSTVFHAGAPVTLNNPGFSSISQPFNYARLRTQGIDADINYRHDLGEDRALSLRGIVSYLIRRDQYSDITRPDYRNRLKSELGDPEWRFQLSTKLEWDNWAISHQLQYLGKQILSGFEYETFYPLQDRDPLNPDATPRKYYPAKWYHDLRLEVDATDQFNFYLGVDNVFDTQPPFDLLGTEGGSLYDPTGRFFYAGVRAKF